MIATVLNTDEGIISQIIGPVIDAEFQPGYLPDIYTSLLIKTKDYSIARLIITIVVSSIGGHKPMNPAIASSIRSRSCDAVRLR